MTVKTNSEIKHLKKTYADTLDLNHDGTVDKNEFAAKAPLAKAELDAYGITDTTALEFWTKTYSPNTEVVKDAAGNFRTTDKPQTVRGDAVAAYNSGNLADTIIDIEADTIQNETKVALAKTRLSALEFEWQQFHRDPKNALSPAALRANFSKYCAMIGWGNAKMDPAETAKKFSDTELKIMAVACQWMDFLATKNIFYKVDSFNLIDMLSSPPGQMTGGCQPMCALALHMFKSVGIESFKPVYLYGHVTLSFETSIGPLYLEPQPDNPAKENNDYGFNPPGYYDNRPTTHAKHRELEPTGEPWQILAYPYVESGVSNFGVKNYEEARGDFETALEIAPECLSARYNLAFLLKTIGETKEAKEELKKLLAINKYNKPALELLHSLGG